MAEREVRPIVGQELDEVLPLIAEYQKFYRAEPDAERNRRFFSRFLHPSQEGLLLGAWLDGGLAGFATLYWFFSSTKAAESVLMNDLFVREDVRGAGVGRALIERAVEEARRRGAAHLEWFTAPDNLVAQGLYDTMTGAVPSMWRAYEIDVAGPSAKPQTSDQAPGEETVQVNDQYKGGGPAASPGPREHAQHQTGG
jgi:GNAT superfamily N-acetyltransferase